MNGDLQLKQHVEDELQWDPRIDASTIGVAVKDAIVTLSGHCPSFRAKRAAETAVLRIHGVRAIASELDVRYPADPRRTDEDIARAAALALLWNVMVPDDRVTVQVSHGTVTLRGTVEWEYQRIAAQRAVEDLMGVKAVENLIALRAATICADVKSEIESALKRSAEVDARHILVTLSGNNIILSGIARTLVERTAAEAAAWKAPGVRGVVNDIQVSPESVGFAAA
jgi:osmotically-inducible protein OsmY